MKDERLADLQPPFLRQDGRVWVPATSKPGVPTWRWGSAIWWRLVDADSEEAGHLRRILTFARQSVTYMLWQRRLQAWLLCHGNEWLPVSGHFAPDYASLSALLNDAAEPKVETVRIMNIWLTQSLVARERVGHCINAMLCGDAPGHAIEGVRFRGSKRVILTRGHDRYYAATVLEWKALSVHVVQLDATEKQWLAQNERQLFVMDVLDEAIEILRDNRKVAV